MSYITERTKELLRQQPEASIISVSQEDNNYVCNSSSERAIIEEEGSPMGPLLRAVNAVAQGIEDEFPHVLVDTLAYGPSRTTPNTTLPRKNVVIRLCTSNSNFAVPMTDPSNMAFQEDMEAWARICNRTYIWNYVPATPLRL